ncbi:hypothetical protein AOA57_27200 [Pseudomonas sp. 2588-5]|nr:hypothetical protein AOA57_27200 [Pseudomonas sp. 2588-5]
MKLVSLLDALRGSGLAAAASLLVVMPAHGVVQDITATFRPDPSNPMINKFVNTTPQSGFCPGFAPETCKSLGIFSIRTTEINFSSLAPMLVTPDDARKNAMFKVPSDWRELMVTHTDSGERVSVQMRIAGIGGRYTVPNGVGHNIWNSGRWNTPAAPCLGTGMGVISANYYLWFWRVPEGIGACTKFTRVDLSRLTYDVLDYAYELKTPDPLRMFAGTYTGSLTYSIGPGGDFDMGDIMIPNDNALTFNFTLTVDHHLKVEVPPGGHRIQLEPQGGWQGWLQSGRKPTRLFHDQTVNLWASTAFKMSLECGDPLGNTCSVRNAAGHQVPLDIAVTLPAGLSDSAGRPVSRLPLRLDGSGTQLFRPSRYVDRKPSTLHFEIQADGVSQMLDQNSGNAYSGTATVVWDSEV